MKHVDKPWGYEKIWAHTEKYVGKVLHIEKGHKLSLQYHNIKDETIYVQSGKLLFTVEENGEIMLSLGSLIHIVGGVGEVSWQVVP